MPVKKTIATAGNVRSRYLESRFLQALEKVAPPPFIPDVGFRRKFELQQRLDEILGSTYSKQSSDDTQSSHLTKLRDTFLPKFISGEFQAPDAERLTKNTEA